MGGAMGVVETKEVVSLAAVVTVALIKEVKKDGFQLEDLAQVLQSEEFLAAVGPALAGVSKVPSEIGEVDFADGLELGKHVYAKVMEVLEAVKA